MYKNSPSLYTMYERQITIIYASNLANYRDYHMTTSTTHLTPQQLTTLKIIYKFRFITADLLSQYRQVTPRTANESLATLFKAGYIGRHYDSSYKLLGKAARYYLATQSIKWLAGQAGLNDRVLRARYKDKSATEGFIDSSLQTFTVALAIRSQYPQTFTIFTQYELADYDYFPRPLPSLYLKRTEPGQAKPNAYFIEIIGDMQFFVITKRLTQYIEHVESGEWPGGAYPQIIFKVNTPTLKKRLAAYIETLIENGSFDEDEVIFRSVVSLAQL